MVQIKSVAALLFASVMALSLMFTAPAHAGGSDSPVSYEIDVEGLTLSGTDTFPAHGHVNIKYLVDGVEKSKGIHFDPNNSQPGGKWIGRSFIPWTAFAEDIECITWIQIHGYNEHFGEGGQEPFCLQKPPTAPPEDAEYKETITEINCEERTISWIKEKREAIFEYDWTVPEWKNVGWTDWVQIDSGFRNEKDVSCNDLPTVGSPVNLAMVGIGGLALLAGATVMMASRRRA